MPLLHRLPVDDDGGSGRADRARHPPHPPSRDRRHGPRAPALPRRPPAARRDRRARFRRASRLHSSGDDYRLLARWVGQGMPVGSPTDRSVAGIEVFPKLRTLPLGGEQQLLVTARYTDGSTQDVTRGAVYEANDREMAAVDAS